jgi:hypothetical protein
MLAFSSADPPAMSAGVPRDADLFGSDLVNLDVPVLD